MATDELVHPRLQVELPAATQPAGLRSVLYATLSALASLRLTVVLFALAIFLVFVGTLAQVDHGVWYVVDHTYFRVWFAWVDWQVFERLVQVFYPVDWQLGGGFPYPGGKLLGCLLLVNLLAAHGVRFKVAASGGRLIAGLAMIALGVLITALSVRSGLNGMLESELSSEFCLGLWYALKSVLPALVLVGLYVLIFRFGRIRRFEWWLLAVSVVLLTSLTVWLAANPQVRLDDADLRILWQLLKGLGAGAVLLAGCVLVFRQRAGVVLLHGGVALLMFSELLTGLSSQESQMTIAEGQSVNYSQDIRTAELAVVEHIKPGEDHVTVVPQSLLERNVGSSSRIASDQLPFEIQVHQWLPNSDLATPSPGRSNSATAGLGRDRVAELLPRATGVDAASAVDMPSAYVELFAKSTGQSLGIYLLSALLPEQPVEVDGRTYDVGLRFERLYYPFSVTLDDFRFDRYMGTNTAKNYSSEVKLKDPGRNVDRTVLISMNNPLRYDDLTLYQASFDEVTEQTTVLQVVRNAGWMIPYVACMLVLTGMLAHFGVALARFSRRRAEEAARLTPLADGQSSAWAKWFPAIVVAVFALYLGSKARMPQAAPSEMQINQFAKLPLAYQGRIKPYDTLARNTLQILSERQEVTRVDGDKETKLPAIHWLLDVISGAKGADEHRVFRIENLEVLDTLGLEPRSGSFQYSLAELRDKLPELDHQIKLARAQPETQRSLYQRKVLDLAQKLSMYGLLIQSFQPPQIRPDQQFLAQDIQQAQQDILRLREAVAPRAVPPMSPDLSQTEWKTLKEAEYDLLRDRLTGKPGNPATVSLATLLSAYASGDVSSFNKQLTDFRRELGTYDEFLAANASALRAAGLKKAEIFSQARTDFEHFFNHFSPFYYLAAMYLFAFLLGFLSFLMWDEPLRRAAFWLLVFTLAVHTLALVARIYISGRPPVINLYSTAVFIGWGAVLMALLLEVIYRLGLGNLVAAVVGFLTLIVAHFLSLDGDTMIVLQPVLDTQFWLSTHVITVNMGYAATYLAGALGISYVIFVQLLGEFDEDQRRQLTRMTYGTLCFAIFFSFIGTVLGGLWADNSWGRFWGWDPKENGALMIVLYNALALHARWGGLVKGRGLALLAIGGNIVTTWSYFGTNELGVGLHAYGGSDRNTAMWMLTLVVSQVVLILLGAIPQNWLRRRTSTNI